MHSISIGLTEETKIHRITSGNTPMITMDNWAVSISVSDPDVTDHLAELLKTAANDRREAIMEARKSRGE